MTSRSFRQARGPRRAAAVDPTTVLAPNSGLDDGSSLISQGLAALAVSALGLGLVATVTLTAGAQSTVTASSTVAGQGSPDTTQAKAAPPAPQAQGEQAIDNRGNDEPEQSDGALGAFGRSSSDGTSRNAVRAEIDRAVADQKARERGATLSMAEEKQSQSSGAAVQDARSTNLVNTAEASKREQARLAEEKRKAEEALKKAQEAAQNAQNAQGSQGGNLPAQAAPAAAAAAQSSSKAPAAAPQVSAAAPAGSAGVNARGASPMAPGSYSLGARWGAVGSWSRYHTGQDLPAPVGTQLRAAAGGVVMSPNGGGWAGTHVVIRHADGSATLYAHMSTSLVRPGQTVTAGQPIGAVGMTGRTFGPHLHFEHYPSGVVGNPYVTDDPYRWMLSLGVRL
ncbi:peptidoglycan DD-metalloendopeptidase family protein [Mariniluteicoccus flavus]